MVSYQPTMLGTRYMCSAGHYLASRAGFDILEAGGNAVDAGVAAAMSLAVLQSDIVNVGGVAPMITPAYIPIMFGCKNSRLHHNLAVSALDRSSLAFAASSKVP